MKNIESICHKCVNYDSHNRIIKKYKPKNVSSCQYPVTKNNFDGLFNIIWDDYMLKYNLMSSPIYLSGINKYGEFVDKENNKNKIYIEEITYDNFKSLLKNDQKNILDYCEIGKYEKIINTNEVLKKHNIKLQILRKNICEKMKEELPKKKTFLIDLIKNNKNSDLLMYKEFIYNFLRNENILNEFGKEKIVDLEKKRLKTLEKISVSDWFKWWRYLLNNLNNLNIIDIFWIFKKIEELEVYTKDKNFYKLIISTFVKNLIKCNQEYENICIPEILKMIKSEINCKTLTTDGLYSLLLKNENFNKLVKLNINELNEIHYFMTIQKTKLKKACMTDFIIDEFSTNNRFENFFEHGNYEPYFWKELEISENDKNIIEKNWFKNMDRLIKLEKKTNMNQYIDRLLDISESLKNNQLYYLESPNLFSEYLNSEKDLRNEYINNDGPIAELIKLSNIPEIDKNKFEL
ncbi:1263_t:CDS:1 [Scutellospora calospora]|uniref:1263_t:CDS:1 n=1 Tax=Scutellospora calospora TaxID=85575 RepID=A0ACA9LC99_9GLOM|nr:1263_t:CDS:1 [Scutellospora calospora]